MWRLTCAGGNNKKRKRCRIMMKEETYELSILFFDGTKELSLSSQRDMGDGLESITGPLFLCLTKTNPILHFILLLLNSFLFKV